jgi:hypothetical protein
MANAESSVFRPTPTEQDTHPHACTEGVVEIGDEVERLEVVPCRRCADSR